MVGQTKQAKTLTDDQLVELLGWVSRKTRFPERNTAIVLLSFKAGLRAREIAGLRWEHVTDNTGFITDEQELALTNDATKGKSGRNIPIQPALRDALRALQVVEREKGRGGAGDYAVTLAKGNLDLASRSSSVAVLFNGKSKVAGWYSSLGLVGCTSHSGRRTFITNAARNISRFGGSLEDCRRLAGHASLVMTSRYIDKNSQAMKDLIRNS